jgi:DNA-binding IclR family transcriptional regulator
MLAAARRSNAPQSVMRVINILETLSVAPGPVSLAELSRSLHTPKTSLAALLRGLVAADVIAAADGCYRLGPGAFGLGSALVEARRRLQSSELIRAGMRRLAARSGETVLFAVRDADATTLSYVDIVESPKAVRFAVAIGDRRPLYCTAAGRALLAAAPEADVRRYLKQSKLRRLTVNTETDKRRLAALFVEARAHGVAVTVDQAADGVTGTAAVTRDSTGSVLGALVVAAPSSRLRDRAAALSRQVRDEAAAISRSLGHRAG